MRTMHVVVEEYNPIWEEAFNKIASEIKYILLGDIIAIEHVGSTSIYGLAAKPIIDLDVIIQSMDTFDIIKNKLEEAGYVYEGDLGIKEREAFAYIGKEHLMAHHLYVCPKDSKELYRHITFRNYLREHLEDVKRYADVKRKAAKLYPYDIDKYCDMKQPLIEEIYNKCGLK